LNMKCMTGRRTKLPVPRPDTEGLSLWNLLCKNIGKDLSQVSMPVALNEPLNMLQVISTFIYLMASLYIRSNAFLYKCEKQPVYLNTEV